MPGCFAFNKDLLRRVPKHGVDFGYFQRGRRGKKICTLHPTNSSSGRVFKTHGCQNPRLLLSRAGDFCPFLLPEKLAGGAELPGPATVGCSAVTPALGWCLGCWDGGDKGWHTGVGCRAATTRSERRQLRLCFFLHTGEENPESIATFKHKIEPVTQVRGQRLCWMRLDMLQRPNRCLRTPVVAFALCLTPHASWLIKGTGGVRGVLVLSW